MNKHEEKLMLELVLRLSVHFQRSWESNEQYAILAIDWAEDLAGYPWQVVQAAAKLCRTEPGRKHYPTTGEMVAYCEQALGDWRRQQNRLALPEQVEQPLTEQEQSAQLERLRAFREQFSGLVESKRIGGAAS